MSRFFLLPLLLLCGCTISERGITINLPDWGKRSTVVVPPRPVPDRIPHRVDPLPKGQMRVLVIEDVSQRHKLTKEQNTMLFKTSEPSMRDFIKSNGVKDGFRLVDKETKLSGVWDEMKSKHPPQSFPWIIFENDGKAESTSLTAYPTELLNQFAGVKP